MAVTAPTQPVSHDTYSDAHIRKIPKDTRSIAMVGASGNSVRPSNFVARYLVAKGYELYPVNPGHAGKTIAGTMTYAALADLPVAVDMVDVFRRVEDLPQVVSDIMQMEDLPKYVWLQLGIRDDSIAAALEMAGIVVVQNRCPKIEYARLCGEIGWNGFNRRTISSRKPLLQKGFQHYGLAD